MRLIDYTYFQFGQCRIPVNGTGDVATGQIAEINNLIDIVQPAILKEVMSEAIYNEFMLGMAETTVLTKWTDMAAQIRNTTAKTSFLVNFVYYDWKIMSASVDSQHGDQTLQADNMQRQMDYRKNVTLWNAGVDAMSDFIEWLEENKTTYSVLCVYEIEKLNVLGI